jgi:hypothetical protein
LPDILRQHYWLRRILQLFGLAGSHSAPQPGAAPALPLKADVPTEPTNPQALPVLPAEFVDVVEAYRRGNMEYFVTGSLLKLQDRDVARTMVSYLRKIHPNGTVDESNILQHIADFRNVYLKSPIANNHGGANYTTGLKLFLIAKHLNPAFVVECGVYRGMSSMIFKAALPQAKIVAFDISLSAAHLTDGVEYHESDWMAVAVNAKDTALAYFDDHVNQAMRLIQAHRRGFRYIIVDDSWSWGAISGCGGVPLPSVDMLMSDDLKVGDTVEWVQAGQLWTYTHDEEMEQLCSNARKLVKAAYDIPSLFRETGVAPTSALKFVELVGSVV